MLMSAFQHCRVYGIRPFLVYCSPLFFVLCVREAYGYDPHKMIKTFYQKRILEPFGTPVFSQNHILTLLQSNVTVTARLDVQGHYDGRDAGF